MASARGGRDMRCEEEGHASASGRVPLLKAPFCQVALSYSDCPLSFCNSSLPLSFPFRPMLRNNSLMVPSPWVHRPPLSST